jgi:hypothetical protein
LKAQWFAALSTLAVAGQVAPWLIQSLQHADLRWR